MSLKLGDFINLKFGAKLIAHIKDTVIVKLAFVVGVLDLLFYRDSEYNSSIDFVVKLLKNFIGVFCMLKNFKSNDKIDWRMDKRNIFLDRAACV